MTARSDAPVVGVGVVVEDHGSLLLVQRANAPNKGLWAVPGGKVRAGETLQGAAKREVQEETGLSVDIGRVVWVGEHIEQGHHLILIDFEGTVSGGKLSPADDAADARWVPLTELGDFDLTPTMHDLIESLFP